jgi:AcrR family transcriptional regulator
VLRSCFLRLSRPFFSNIVLWLEKHERSSYDSGVRRGELTRQAILERATSLASQVGLDGLSIGILADELHLSKSGLFAHFKSKDALQVQVIDFAASAFVEEVVRPALRAPRGEPRLRALFDQWLVWDKARPGRGGCLFVGAASELDDRPGPARDRVVRAQREWMTFLAHAAELAVREGHLHQATDVDQFAHDLYCVMLGYHHAARLLEDPAAETRARRGFERLLAMARSAPIS